MESKSKYKVTPDNQVEIARKFVQDDINKMGDDFPFADIEDALSALAEAYNSNSGTQTEIAWVDAVSEFFNSTRRVFLDMPSWMFSIFSDEFLTSDHGTVSFQEIFNNDPEKQMESEDLLHEETTFIENHFGGSVIKYIEAGGCLYMRQWKESNSIFQFPTTRVHS
jgi:hypothetical protein